MKKFNRIWMWMAIAATDSVAPGFGKATGRVFMPHAIKKLPRR